MTSTVKVNFDNNEAAKVQIEKQLLDFSERELQIKKQLAELNTAVTRKCTLADTTTEPTFKGMT
jgi:hypothetical protein